MSLAASIQSSRSFYPVIHPSSIHFSHSARSLLDGRPNQMDRLFEAVSPVFIRGWSWSKTRCATPISTTTALVVVGVRSFSAWRIMHWLPNRLPIGQKEKAQQQKDISSLGSPVAQDEPLFHFWFPA
ncbi:hypothetical protein HRR83_004676 [Exophiala dermatitidis]|nr:hypothetical protein HRR77_007000 [Exophiala dermatitidis]KAJ4597245.1 hypothetical protein HRR83_004676 [Exophiala dermatitidis]KAJ4637423.1 hypothetical protein HRR89_006657 [Exophiala dermatitidis]KAJ4650874.1 hypothetical protein HRR91_005483 [Exophiala dermatitidis]KAJ4651812.1 hypothetical protein HRR90_005099 [Exophiala dermatitidis]